jgi:hypothetical protein
MGRGWCGSTGERAAVSCKSSAQARDEYPCGVQNWRPPCKSLISPNAHRFLAPPQTAAEDEQLVQTFGANGADPLVSVSSSLLLHARA